MIQLLQIPDANFQVKLTSGTLTPTNVVVFLRHRSSDNNADILGAAMSLSRTTISGVYPYDIYDIVVHIGYDVVGHKIT
jgi:hypothetical protein